MRPSETIPLLATALALAGCEGPMVTDDFGSASHATLSGIVTRRGGVPYADGSLFVRCGVTVPVTFGLEGSTNQTGNFRIALVEPMGPSRDSAVVLRCLLSAGAPAFVQDSVDVLFAPMAVAAPETVDTLVEQP